ncbi:MAG: VOC family protein [Nitriliruptoraceae bacterium]
MPIDTVPDHVAVAVYDIEVAARRWHDELGGGWVGPAIPVAEAGFTTRQLRYAGGAKLELLEPASDGGFAATFLERFGPRVHHVTLKVADLLAAVSTLEDEGFEVVDVATDGDMWHEGFLRPSQVGGLIVQIAWAGYTDADFAARFGAVPEEPAADAATLHGPLLTHPDLSAARAVWTALGAEVTEEDGGLTAGWPGEPLTIRIEPGDTADAPGLRIAGRPPLPADPQRGPATLTP